MTKDSAPPSALRAPLSTRGLSPQQRSLVDFMRKHRYGRIENVPVREGQPIIGQDVTVVRIAHLGGKAREETALGGEEFELKRAVRDLFDELAGLKNGRIVRLEFRHGLPFLLETSAS